KHRIVAARKKGDTVITTMFGPELPDKPYRVLPQPGRQPMGGPRGPDPESAPSPGNDRHDDPVPLYVSGPLHHAEVQRRGADARPDGRLRGDGPPGGRGCGVHSERQASEADHLRDDGRGSIGPREKFRRCLAPPARDFGATSATALMRWKKDSR